MWGSELCRCFRSLKSLVIFIVNERNRRKRYERFYFFKLHYRVRLLVNDNAFNVVLSSFTLFDYTTKAIILRILAR